MRVTILGCGGYVPERDKGTSSYMVEAGKDVMIFDFGRGCINQIMRMGKSCLDISHVFITHSHADHWSELVSLLHIVHEPPKDLEHRKKDLVIYCPLGMKRSINMVMEAFKIEEKAHGYKVLIRELEDRDTIRGDTWNVTGFSVTHSKIRKSLAYRIESKGRIFAYSGDTSYCLGIVKACDKADVAIIEATNPFEKETHLSGREAGRLAEECKVGKLILTHMGYRYKRPQDAVNDAKEFYKGKILVAKDGIKINV